MRLIDADNLLNILEEMADNEWNKAVGSSNGLEEAIEVIENTPTVETDIEFAKWVTKIIFDIKVEDFDLFSELACRKLEKLGLVKKTESKWIKAVIE